MFQSHGIQKVIPRIYRSRINSGAITPCLETEKILRVYAYMQRGKT